MLFLRLSWVVGQAGVGKNYLSLSVNIKKAAINFFGDAKYLNLFCESTKFRDGVRDNFDRVHGDHAHGTVHVHHFHQWTDQGR